MAPTYTYAYAMQVVLVGAGTLGITLLLCTLLYNSIWGGAAEC